MTTETNIKKNSAICTQTQNHNAENNSYCSNHRKKKKLLQSRILGKKETFQRHRYAARLLKMMVAWVLGKPGFWRENHAVCAAPLFSVCWFRSLLFLQRKSEDAVHVYLHVRPFCIHEFNDNFPQLLCLAETDTRLGFFVIWVFHLPPAEQRYLFSALRVNKKEKGLIVDFWT